MPTKNDGKHGMAVVACGVAIEEEGKAVGNGGGRRGGRRRSSRHHEAVRET